MQDNKARLRGKSFKTFPTSLWMECSWVFWEEFLVSLLDVSFKWPFTIHLTFWARWQPVSLPRPRFALFQSWYPPQLVGRCVGHGGTCDDWQGRGGVILGHLVCGTSPNRLASLWTILEYRHTFGRRLGHVILLSCVWPQVYGRDMVESPFDPHSDASDILRFPPNVFLKYSSVVLLCSHSYSICISYPKIH